MLIDLCLIRLKWAKNLLNVLNKEFFFNKIFYVHMLANNLREVISWKKTLVKHCKLFLFNCYETQKFHTVIIPFLSYGYPVCDELCYPDLNCRRKKVVTSINWEPKFLNLNRSQNFASGSTVSLSLVSRIEASGKIC